MALFVFGKPLSSLLLLVISGFIVAITAKQGYFYSFSRETNDMESLSSGNEDDLTERFVRQQNTLTHARSDNPRGSRSGQEKLVLEVLRGDGDERPGFFIDLAANDYKQNSNTYVLEADHGWGGICIEANRKYLAGHLLHRPGPFVLNAVSNNNGEILDFILADGNGGLKKFHTSKMAAHSNPTEPVTTVKLETVLRYLDAPSTIDYFSLDVEGAELSVLSNFDFDQYTFLTLSVERPPRELHDLLSKNGYYFAMVLDPWGECFYLHVSAPNFDEKIRELRQRRKFTYTEWVLRPAPPPPAAPPASSESRKELPPADTEERRAARLKQLRIEADQLRDAIAARHAEELVVKGS
mmetsp:Transcript_6419/g.11286  ORF Transcript_6419/g.11286 Transcript_6419/m.11286 type:complete len:353 (+) Transcript_6419:65-1123(+)